MLPRYAGNVKISGDFGTFEGVATSLVFEPQPLEHDVDVIYIDRKGRAWGPVQHVPPDPDVVVTIRFTRAACCPAEATVPESIWKDAVELAAKNAAKVDEQAHTIAQLQRHSERMSQICENLKDAHEAEVLEIQETAMRRLDQALAMGSRLAAAA